MPGENLSLAEALAIPATVVALGGGMIGMVLKDMPGMLETANAFGKAAAIGGLVDACCVAIEGILRKRS